MHGNNERELWQPKISPKMQVPGFKRRPKSALKDCKQPRWKQDRQRQRYSDTIGQNRLNTYAARAVSVLGHLFNVVC